jgi:hypothetical protein
MRLLRLALVLVVAAVAAPAALADTPVIPDDSSLPWSDPSHGHPLEALAGQIASRIAGRPVSVRCEGETDWQRLLGGDAGGVGGFVRVLWQWDGSRWSPVFDGGGIAQLSPRVCTYLAQFARATTKPTKCAVPQTQQQTRYETVSYKTKVRVKVKKRVRVKGRSVIRNVWVTRTVWKKKRVAVTEMVTVSGSPQPCYVGGGPATSMPGGFWTEYSHYAWALQTLVHEASHLAGDVGVLVPDGYPSPGWVGYTDYEIRAECHGMQWISYAAQQLGDQPTMRRRSHGSTSSACTRKSKVSSLVDRRTGRLSAMQMVRMT